jgi:hypothetical protein
MRNPASVRRARPELVDTMAPLRDLLLECHAAHPSLHNLAQVCGPSPSRDPPSTSDVAALRKTVNKALGLSSKALEARHVASPWRFAIVREVHRRSKDPDTPLSDWLEHGAPMGLSQVIEKSGLFPEQTGSPELDLDELAAKATVRSNHPSFSELHGETVAPGIKLLEKQLNSGFGILFSSRAAAEAYLGAQVHPAPLGNIAKLKPDGSFKHRLIQDLRG